MFSPLFTSFLNYAVRSNRVGINLYYKAKKYSVGKPNIFPIREPSVEVP